MSKHTPGPWTRGQGDPESILSTENYYCVAQANTALPNMDANARLIAAAPELLEAATRIMAAMRSVFTFSDMADDEWIYDELGSDLAGAYFDARAAIAKATGEPA